MIVFLVVGAGLEYERLQMCFPGQIVFRGEFVLTDFRNSSGVCTLVCTMSQRFVLGAAGGMVLGLYVWHVASRRRRRRTTAPSADTARCSTAPTTLRPTRAGAATRRRVKLVLEYDGSAFCGWQTQEARRRDGAVSTRGSSPAMRAVQDAVEAAVLALSTTDRGVHATGQVAAVSICTALNDAELRRCLNTRLPEDVAVRSVNTVPPTFDPRRNARWKRYELPFVL